MQRQSQTMGRSLNVQTDIRLKSYKPIESSYESIKKIPTALLKIGKRHKQAFHSGGKADGS